jgi:hypothetical protein
VRLGNPAHEADQALDYTLSCALRVQGEMPAGIESAWNIGKRFARLAVQGEFLVLEMDVIVAGGVAPSYLQATAELWDRLLQEFLLFLRQHAAANQEANSADQGEAVAAQQAAAQVTVEPTEAEPTEAAQA